MNVFRKDLIRKSVCTIMSFIMVWTPTWAVAETTENVKTDMAKIGRETQKESVNLVRDALKTRPQVSGNQITLPMKDGESVNIDTSEIVPTDRDNVKYSADKASIDRAQAMYDQPGRLTDEGGENKKNLFKDAESEKPTIEGHVYSILVDMSNKNNSNIINSDDSMFEATNKVYDNIEQITQDLSSCKADTVFKDITSKKHYPDYKHCSQVMDRSGACTIYHNYRAGVITHYDGPFNLKSCGKDCTQLWIGKVGNDYWAGSCSIYEEWTRVKVPNPDAVTRAVFEYAKWDDYMQVWVGEPGKEELIWGGPDGKNVFPPETAGRCERGTSWERNPNVDVTRFFKNVDKNAIVNFKIRVSVTGRGEGFGRIRVYFDPAKAVHDESWTPNNCLEAAYGVQDGFASGKVVCTKNPADSSGCAWFDGVQVCPDQLNPSPLKGIPNLCQQVSVSADFDFYKGQMDCWIDARGQKQCPVNTGGNLDSCTKYANNPKCGFISAKCTEGALGASGQCYVNDVTYDCGEDVIVNSTESETVYNCPGDISCMGSECMDTQKSNSTDFAKVTALLNATQYMTQDMSCTGTDENGDFTGQENITCTVFSGDPGECKIAVGGVSDCCESQPGIGLGSYLSMIKSVADMDAAMNELAKEGTEGVLKDIAGQYVDITGPAKEVVKEGVDWITKPFTSYIENIKTGISDFMQPVKDVVNQLLGELKQKCAEVLQQVFKEAGMDITGGVAGGGSTAAGQQSATEATGMLAQGATVFSVVMAIYTAYVVATMIIQMVYKCTEDEYELVSQRELKNCHYIGSYCKSKKLGVCIEKRESYCCYKSPLSRIMNEQIRLQGDVLGVEFDGFGSPKHPKCAGVPLEKVGQIDWNRVNLDEWIAILEQNGQLPNEQNINIDKLTGKGSKLDINGDRLNSIDRIKDKIKDIDVDGLRTESNQSIEVDTGYSKKE